MDGPGGGVAVEPLGDWRRTHLLGDLSAELDGEEVVVGGWIHETRNLGGLCFVVLRDRSGRVQVTLVKRKDGPLFSRLASLSRESVVMVCGVVQASEKAGMGFEIRPSGVKVLSVAEAPLPLGVADVVGADMDTRLDNRFLDLRKPEVSAIFKIRSTILEGVRDALRREGFVEVHTPKIVATATEGGTSLFPMKYFDRPAFLNQSPQLYKQILMASGLDRVMEIGPAFRAEEHDTSRHLNEFTSIDIEMSFADEEDAMGMLEKAIEGAREMVWRENQKELDLLGISLPEQKPPYPRITYDECVEMVSSRGLDMEWGEDLSMEATRIVAEEMEGFYFITRWPTEEKPFYAMPFEDRPEVCRAFDLNYREKEVTSGAQRIHDPVLLEKRIRDQGLDPRGFEFYLRAFRYGVPPHAGWGLGAERITMIFTQADNIRECVLFPRDRHRLVP
ncbi:MAG: aspartate--tRNA(Asn) ligase [Thermoplasmata archaeon]|nr:aspartate--tRNA(Asn) ligase [Thermoplasmata archaeon]